MTKSRIRILLLCAGIFVAGSVVHGGGVPNVEVTVSDGAGQLRYRGKTDANGVFATGRIAGGSYVVQFNVRNVAGNRNDYAIFAAAGHQRVVADAVSGAKLAGAGVAMRLKSTTGTLIVGQVAVGGLDALGTKIVNGVRYILAPPETGDLGPRWVEEGTHSARNITRVKIEDPSMIKGNLSGSAR